MAEIRRGAAEQLCRGQRKVKISRDDQREGAGEGGVGRRRLERKRNGEKEAQNNGGSYGKGTINGRVR